MIYLPNVLRTNGRESKGQYINRWGLSTLKISKRSTLRGIYRRSRHIPLRGRSGHIPLCRLVLPSRNRVSRYIEGRSSITLEAGKFSPKASKIDIASFLGYKVINTTLEVYPFDVNNILRGRGPRGSFRYYL